MLRVKRRKVYELVRNHGLPVVRLGARCLRFNLAAIEAWLEAQQEAELASWQRPVVAFRRSR
jgi:excisionase family DNA binding protein